MRRSRVILLMLPALLGLAAAPAGAWPESPDVTTERTTATLVALPADGTDSIAVGLRLRLKPGWHTYWRNPGDAGEAVAVRLAIGERSSTGPTIWPLPEMIEASGVVSYGHHGEAVFTTVVSVPRDGAPTRIEAEATWLACAEVCVPESGKFSLVAPAGAAPPAAPSTTAATPARGDGVLAGAPGAWRVSAPWRTPAGARIESAYFFPYDGASIDHSAPQKMTVDSDTLALALKPLDPRRTPPRAIEGLLRVDVRAGGGLAATWIELTARAAPPAE
ncbi:MAG: hypothetical protein IPK81_16720 [Rhodospirillales bacterium]|nr:MAG: hypothetical protein IPK81_16720 [Rhodospirillales bacterium]